MEAIVVVPSVFGDFLVDKVMTIGLISSLNKPGKGEGPRKGLNILHEASYLSQQRAWSTGT
jgi:hypothetical protein